MDSIIQTEKYCFVCGQAENGDHLDKHHVFGGALRKKSEKFGLTVYLHHNKCHIFGQCAVHQNSVVNNMVKQMAQKRAMQYYNWSVEDFRKEFHKNYL